MKKRKNHDISVSFRVTGDEYEQLLDLAENQGCNLSQFIRYKLFRRGS